MRTPTNASRVVADVLVIGSGVAGLSAAVAASLQGARVIVVSKGDVLQPHSLEGAGMNGIVGDEIDWRVHAFDTIRGGDFLCDQDAVEVLCREASTSIVELAEFGAPFRPELVGRFGRHVYNTPDITGASALAALSRVCADRGVTLRGGVFITDLIVKHGHCVGARADFGSELFSASAVVLASGGCGQMFRTTTNAAESTADGLALAWRAGADLADMEMLQQHPTALVDGTLISESARAAGAILRNRAGEPFMNRYAPTAKELAPRDIVSRAIWQELRDERGDNGFVYLDFRDIDPAYWGTQHIEAMRSRASRLLGVDIRVNLLPVRPAMHYCMGGVRTDLKGQTPVAGLFAAGETACVSVHGANRLGGNSLLECRVFGRRAGAAAATAANQRPAQLASPSSTPPATGSAGPWVEASRRRMQLILDDCLGAERTATNLESAARTLEEMVAVRDRARAIPSRQTRELANCLDIAPVIVASALARRESRGSHHRLDFPARNDADWLLHTVACRAGRDEIEWRREPVRLTQWPLSERAY